ncbi:hypothetical protein BKA62DRAFT_102215 [Auriculariales sp. MPI-PUGE-AT-0066]|nr:hypothetical protein BKA62DRAFT_102215 [Auriculariales sp. MPI-PUGE-AT-0066]
MAVGPREAASPLTVASIARTQQFDGGFPADSSFPIDHLQLQKIPATPAALVGAGDVLMALWHTILALVVLKKRFSTTDERESWELIDEKAREWAMEKIDNVLDVGNREEAAMLLAKWLEIAESGI